MSKKKVLYLRWLDSATLAVWSSAPSTVGQAEIETVGFLVYEDKEQVQIAQSSLEDEKFDAITAIPKSVILERRVLRKP